MKKKIFVIISIILIITFVFYTNTYASSIDDLGNLKDYMGGKYVGANSAFKAKVQIVVSVISNIGVVISVIALIGLGIKYMIGSVEERAEYKKTMIPYIIGAFMVFSITTLPQFIFSITKNL